MIARFFAFLFGGKLGSLESHRNHITKQIDSYRKSVADEQSATDDAIVRLTARLAELKNHALHQF